MKDDEVAIIGGNGFVGTRLANRFDIVGRKYTVYDIDVTKRPNKDIYLDVEDKETLKHLSRAKCIINLAAVHHDNIRPLSRYDDVNITGAVNVCNAARIYNIQKIIFSSSVAIYGFAPPDADETSAANYFNDYGRTKYLAEGVYKEWQAEEPEKRTLVIVRPTVIFGEANRGNVYNLLKQIASRRFVMFGNGKNRKSMAYVENVAAFFEYCLEFDKGLHIFNYIDKPDYDMNTLVSQVRKILFGRNNVGLRLPAFLGMFIGYAADAVAKLIGKPLPVSSIRLKKFMGTTQFASSTSPTNFSAPVSLEDGLARTLHYEFIEDNSEKKTFNAE